jgi:hypothetical protein
MGWRGSTSIATVAIFLGCAAGQYRVERGDVDCEDGNAMAHRAFLNLGYEITRFQPATPVVPGMIEGQRETPDGRRHGRVRITCDGAIAFQPIEGGWFLPTFDFSRDVYYALLSTPAPPEVLTPTIGSSTTGAAGSTRQDSARTGRLQVIMRALDRFEVEKATGFDLHGRALLVVHVVIVNDTRRTYVLDAGRVVLVDGEGERVESLQGSAIGTQVNRQVVTPDPAAEPLPPIDGAAVGSALGAKTLTGGRIVPGETRGGLLYFPAGDYESGRVPLLDEETGEVEGTLVAF